MENYVERSCPFCKTHIREGDAVKICPSCGTVHHEECWIENKGCSIFGCSEQPKEAPNTSSIVFCQSCGASIDPTAPFCTHCGAPRHSSLTPSQELPSSDADVCKACGSPLDSNAKFCTRCGAPRATQTAPHATEPQPAPRSTEVCTACGSPLDSNAKFCTRCGAPVPNPIQASTHSQIPEPNVVVCAACGAPLDSESKFCTHCGTPKASFAPSSSHHTKERSSAYAPPEHTPAKRKPSTRVWIGVGASVVVIALSAFLISQLLMPRIYLNNAEKAFDEQRYYDALTYYEKAGSQDEALYYQKYSYARGIEHFNGFSYLRAAQCFYEAGGLLDSVDQIFNCGLKLIDEKSYAEATTCFNLLPESTTAVAYKSYCKGMLEYGQKNYSQAISDMTLAKSTVPAAEAFLSQLHFEYGKTFFDNKDYTTASAHFESAGDYPEAQTYVNACALMQAEELFEKGFINAAVEAYNKLPYDFSFGDLSVAERLGHAANVSELCKVSGKWVSTENYIKSNKYQFNELADGWYIDTLITEQSLDIRGYLKSDGTVTLDISIDYYQFTNYAAAKENCESTLKTKSFTLEGITSVPASYRIDDYTTLKYANGQFKLLYSERINQTSSGFVLLESTVTFGKQIETY